MISYFFIYSTGSSSISTFPDAIHQLPQEESPLNTNQLHGNTSTTSDSNTFFDQTLELSQTRMQANSVSSASAFSVYDSSQPAMLSYKSNALQAQRSLLEPPDSPHPPQSPLPYTTQPKDSSQTPRSQLPDPVHLSQNKDPSQSSMSHLSESSYTSQSPLPYIGPSQPSQSSDLSQSRDPSQSPLPYIGPSQPSQSKELPQSSDPPQSPRSPQPPLIASKSWSGSAATGSIGTGSGVKGGGYGAGKGPQGLPVKSPER